MKKKVFIVIPLVFIGCNKTNLRQPITHLPEPVSIKGNSYEQEMIADVPSQIEVMGNDLFLFRTKRLLAQGFNKQNGIETICLGYIGEGPGEFMSPYFAGENKKDSTYYVSDMTYNLMRKYKWETGRDTFVFQLIEEKRRTDNENTFYTVQRMDNGFFVALTNAQNTRHPLVLLDNSLNVISEFGEMFEEGEYMNPNLYHGALASNGNQIVFATIDFGYLVSYTISDNAEIKKNWEHFFSPFHFKYVQGKARIDDDRNLRGFYDVKMTEKFIYGLYCGKVRNQNSSKPNLAKNVLVLKHDGTFVRNYSVDEESGRIAIENDSILYVSNVSPDSEIAFYDISILKNETNH